MLMLMLSRLMYGSRLIHAPVPQYSPRLSADSDIVRSGGLPPRIAATMLSSEIAPRLCTVMFGWSLWKAAMMLFITPSSRPVNGFQKLIVTGLPLY